MTWQFVPNMGGRFDGPNIGSEDHFKSSRLSSFVREIVQNSIDAKPINSKLPVKIKFELQEIEKSEFDGFTGIWKHIEASRNQALESKNKIWVDRYNEIIKKYRDKETIKILCVHDANTTGLTGPVDGSPLGSLYAVTKGVGISSKQDDTSGGSFGHGASASFLFSGSRSVYYYSQVNEEEPVYRFVGKSMLQSHKSPYDNSIITVGTGFYANEDDKLTAITDDKIPKWAKQFRRQSGFENGTSVYICDTNFRDDLYDETCISLLANFYYAIKENQLEAIIGNEEINSKNVKEKYKEYKSKFYNDNQRDEIDAEFIEDCFKSIDTIVKPTLKDKIEIENIGKIEWYLRLTDEVKWRKIGISRSIGMLITRNPKFLEVFYGLKNFDMFVCVKGKLGNEMLKKIENPKHDAFELDRVKDLSESEYQSIKRNYRSFTNALRDIVKEHAKADEKDTSIIEELADLFGQLSDDKTIESKTSNRGKKIIISDSITIKNKKVSLSLNKGDKLGAKGKTGKGGKTVIKKDKKDIKYGNDKNLGSVSYDPKGRNVKLINLRVVSSSEDGKKARLFFTNPENITDRPLLIYKKGEADLTELIDIIGSNSYSGKKDQRIYVDLEFTENMNDFVIEGAVNVKA